MYWKYDSRVLLRSDICSVKAYEYIYIYTWMVHEYDFLFYVGSVAVVMWLLHV